jgi:hypothetical protein
MSVDTLACIEAGWHWTTARHTRAECPALRPRIGVDEINLSTARDEASARLADAEAEGADAARQERDPVEQELPEDRLRAYVEEYTRAYPISDEIGPRLVDGDLVLDIADLRDTLAELAAARAALDKIATIATNREEQ